MPESKRELLLRYGEDDVWRALQFYLKQYNKGKPFILAGHSQGSNILARLVMHHWGKTGVDKRLVAGYLIGWSITAQDLKCNPGMKMCRSASQIGCFISYNCVAAGRQKFAPTILPGALVVNPLSWQIDAALVPAKKNLGAVFFSEDGKRTVRPHFTSAKAAGGGLVVKPADPALVASSTDSFPEGVYHCYDYALFYENIKENASERISAFTHQ